MEIAGAVFTLDRLFRGRAKAPSDGWMHDQNSVGWQLRGFLASHSNDGVDSEGSDGGVPFLFKRDEDRGSSADDAG
jgi:hypothetical protein